MIYTLTKWASSVCGGNKQITDYLLINFDWQNNHKLSCDRASRMARTYDIAFDWQRNVILSCGLEGKIKSLDLATGESKVLLELPGKPAIIQLNLFGDLTTFCTHSIRDMFERKQEPFVQIWNYLRLA